MMSGLGMTTGLEQEFGISVYVGEDEDAPFDDVHKRVFKTLGAKSNYFLLNGARLYLDVGAHPEYATPECRTLLNIVTYDKAGERILHDLVVKTEKRELTDQKLPGHIYVYKNNTDSSGESYGTHENYQLPRSLHVEPISYELLGFFITRQMLVGAGKLRLNEQGEAEYFLSQRAHFMHSATGGATTRERSIINSRDESHGDAEHRRLHLIVGDANMSETATMLKVGSTALLLRMMVEGVDLSDLQLADPRAAARLIDEVSSDFTGKETVFALRDGRKMTALQLQVEYLLRAERFAGDKGLLEDPDVAPVLELWNRVLTAIETDKLSLIERDIDWAIKLKLMKDYCAKHEWELTDPRLLQLDLRYHDISPIRGLFYLLQRAGKVNRFTTDEAIARACEVAPPGRPTLRARFMKWASKRGLEFTVDWARVGIVAPADGPLVGVKGVPLLDPTATESAELTKLMHGVDDKLRVAAQARRAQLAWRLNPAPPTLANRPSTGASRSPTAAS